MNVGVQIYFQMYIYICVIFCFCKAITFKPTSPIITTTSCPNRDSKSLMKFSIRPYMRESESERENTL